MQRAEQRQVVRFELVVPLVEDVRNLAPMHEDRLLPRSHDELCSVLDFVLVSRKPPDKRVFRVIDPLDDVNQFATQFVEQPHDVISKT